MITNIKTVFYEVNESTCKTKCTKKPDAKKLESLNVVDSLALA